MTVNPNAVASSVIMELFNMRFHMERASYWRAQLPYLKPHARQTYLDEIADHDEQAKLHYFEIQRLTKEKANR